MSAKNNFPPSETERLILRPLTQNDLDFIFRHFSDPQVNQYLLDEPPITDLAGAQEIVNFYVDGVGKPYNRWVLERKSDGQPLGTCGFHKWDQRYFRAEIGYDLSPEFWRQGYMSEALQAAIQNGFTQMGLNRIEALVYVENQASLKLLGKLGFKREGILRDYFCMNGIFYDHVFLSLLRSEWIKV